MEKGEWTQHLYLIVAIVVSHYGSLVTGALGVDTKTVPVTLETQ